MGNIAIYLVLLAASALFLILERLTHIEFMFHLAAIPLEVFVAVFIVEKFLERREKKEKEPHMFYDLISDYELSSQIRGI